MPRLNKKTYFFILCLYFLFSFQETFSSESSEKLGYGSKCIPPPESKEILKSPQNLVRLDNNPSFRRSPFLTDPQLMSINSLNLNNGMSSNFKSQLRKKVRLEKERAKRQVDGEQNESSTTGDNELTTTSLVMMPGNDKSSNVPSIGTETPATASSLLETALPPQQSLQPSPTQPLEKSTTGITGVTNEPALGDLASPSQFTTIVSSSKPDESGQGIASSLITMSDSAMSASTPRTGTEEGKAQFSLSSPTVETSTADQEPRKDSDTMTETYTMTTMSDRVSIQSVPTSTSGPGDDGKMVVGATVSNAQANMQDSSAASTSFQRNSTEPHQGAQTTPVSLMQSNVPPVAGSMESTVPPITAENGLQANSSPDEETTTTTVTSADTVISDMTSSSASVTAGTSMTQESQGEKVTAITTTDTIHTTTVIPHEDKSIVNNPPESSPAENKTEDVTQSEPPSVQMELSTVSPATVKEPEVPSPPTMTTTSTTIQSGSSLQEEVVKSVSISLPEELRSTSPTTTPIPSNQDAPQEEQRSTLTSPKDVSSGAPTIPTTISPMTSIKASLEDEVIASVSTSPAPPPDIPKESTTQSPIPTFPTTPKEGTTSELTSDSSPDNPPTPATSPVSPTSPRPVESPTSTSEPPLQTPHTSEVSSPSTCDSSLSLTCSTQAPHTCICTSGLTWNDTTRKCSPTPHDSSILGYNTTCTGNSSCSVSAFLVCRDSICRCEDDAYQRWDDSSKTCVSTAGTSSKCSLKEDPSGRLLGCVTHASCRREDGRQDEWGLCECEPGYDNNWRGYCEYSAGYSLKALHSWAILVPSLILLN